MRTRDPWAVEQRNGRMGCVMQPSSLSKAPPEALVSLASGPPGARRRAHRPLLPPYRQVARHDRQAADRRGPRPWGHRQRDRRRRLPARSGLSAEMCGLESGHTGPRPRYILKRRARPAGYTPLPPRASAVTRKRRNVTGLQHVGYTVCENTKLKKNHGGFRLPNENGPQRAGHIGAQGPRTPAASCAVRLGHGRV